MNDSIPQVGAPDPELQTSPIFDEDEERSLDLEQPAAAQCYYNGIAYARGQLVLSGSELLRCEEGGVWVRRGELPAKDRTGD
ncbi:MAG TPA: hypothetical protein VMV45_08570 [Casimicrobiaceae bacterium]|nr:hypothetical protein [Casimicrobiaceae bacterium]